MKVVNDDYENVFICHECFKDCDIQKYIINNGIKKACSNCGKIQEVINSQDKNLIRMIRALIRYHYPEYEYNGHWGGDFEPAELLTEENPIIFTNKFTNSEEKETFKFVMENLVGGIDPNHEIPLYAGYNESGRDLFAYSLKVEGNRTYNKLVSDLEHSNYNDIINKYENILGRMADDLEYRLEEETKLYRARIGFVTHEEKSDEFDHLLKKKIPYEDKNISAPPPKLASPGRANREGISYYYLASDINTSIAEVRPHPGHYVSVAQFEINSKMKIANLVNSKLFENSYSRKQMDSYILFKEISMEFEKPLTPDISNRYYLSQFISDVFKKLGFDGILYNSSVSTGKNFVIFDKSKVSKTKKESELFKILKQSYKIGKVCHNKDLFLDRYDEIISDETI